MIVLYARVRRTKKIRLPLLLLFRVQYVKDLFK